MLKMKRITPVLLMTIQIVLLTLTLSGCASSATAPVGGEAEASAPEAAEPGAASGEQVTISLSGAFALYPLAVAWAEEYSTLNPNVTFDVQAGGAGKGMADMLAGAADVAMLSREPKPEELEQGAYVVSVSIDAVVATVNTDNPVLAQLLTTGITPETANAIWISQEAKEWGPLVGAGDISAINVYTRSDSAGAAEVWALFAGGKAQEDLNGIGVNGDPGLAEAVRNDPLGIGYNNIGFAYNLLDGTQVDGLRVVPIDLNGNGVIDPDENFYETRAELNQAIAEQRYPYPPARILYFVTKGEPSPEIAAFYRWALTDGQRFVAEGGFVPLTAEQIAEALARVGE